MTSPLSIIKNQNGTKPYPRTVSFDWMTADEWMALFNQHNNIAKKGQTQLLFLGDSLTENWDKAIWEHYFSPYQSSNFGIGGDHTGNLLWRLKNLDNQHLSPKLVVLQIGVNNFGHLNETPSQVFNGVKEVIKQCQSIMPHSHILLNGVFPFEQSHKSKRRVDVKNLNDMLKTLAENKKITYRYYGHLLLESNGDISTEIMADFLHPTALAYKIWAEAMSKDIQLLLLR
ncbi:GDSL-type esterase/lipase family protein [Colwellia sp. RE-S-Sl-9]